ncbi:Ribonuclease III domain [Phytophthora infestans]|uniref:Ribonuclease III domain n=1 Tax=Phytophthora infestans TaxID=4787 RepID=A0A833SHR0_PHYIN|nr:Ribonuclease III domain [Phytophthora infestans]
MIMDAALWEHQREIAAVARHRSVLVSSSQPVGKTFVSCALLSEAASSSNTQVNALAIAASPAGRSALQAQLARLCGCRVVCSDSYKANQWLEDPEFARSTLNTVRGQIAILSPLILQEMLRKKILDLTDVGLLVAEDWDLVHAELPSFSKLLTNLMDEMPTATTLRIFATSRLPASKMDWDPVTNPLLKHIHVFNMLPVLSSTSMEPSFPPIHCEVFQNKDMSREEEETSVRDFLLGANDKKVDLVHVFRMELELGNSAAVYDERKKQDKVNRFIQDAEVVKEHLGLWCLWKFVELELQANLQACIVDDPDNVNNRKKRKQQEDDPDIDDSIMGEGIDSDFTEDGAVGEEEGTDEMMECSNAEDSAGKEGKSAQVKTDRLIARYIGNVEHDEDTKLKVRPILKVLSWLSAQSKLCGVLEASPRLLKTAEIVRNRFSNSPGTKQVRAWVFLERRCHCRVVAEYLTAALAGLKLPPSCCMLGSSNARISGALRFSSFLKVMQMFTNYETKIMVTTSVAKKSQKIRMAPPPCDLVVVMNELLEPNKLYEYGKRADITRGFIKYITEDTVLARKKFEGLVRQMQEFIRLEQEENRVHASIAQPASTSLEISSLQMPQPPSTSTEATTPSSADNTLASLQAESRLSVIPERVQPVVNPYELIHQDTGAILNVTNSVSCLSKFCDTLPGLDTYDRRPQYIVRRISVVKHMAPSLKRAKKKLSKYNSKLTDKIDVLKAEAEQRANAAMDEYGDESKDGDEESSATDSRFHFSATLKLPGALGIKKQLHSQQVETQDEAKGIVAFKACQELLKKGLLDRHFRSKLLDDQVATIHKDDMGTSSSNGDSTATGDDTIVLGENDEAPAQLTDLSTQSSYDLPPVSAVELSLRPIRSLTQEAASSSEEGEEWSTTMCFYGLSGAHYAILATNELYTGNTNTGWRYDFATSGVMSPEIQPITLAKRPMELTLTKQELHDVLHFHLVVMRLACMGVQDAVRDVDIASDNVWNEFSEQNDKGYLVVPSVMDESKQPPTLSLDWNYVREIIGKPLLEPLWPLPTTGATANTKDTTDEWICVPTYRLNVSYVVQAISDRTVDDIRKEYLADEKSWTTHLKKGKSTPGNPILGRWHTRQQLEEADADQPLVYGIQVPPIVPIIRRVMQRNNDEGSIAQYKTKFNERLLVPQYTSRLRLSKSRFFDAMGLVPLLYEFERKCQISHLMGKIGLELDMTLLDDATTKPAYERLEILGDTFLKLETSWYMYEQRKDIYQEGQLTQLRRDIIRNDRLNQFALAARLHHYMLYPAEVEQHPFQCWKPSCMGKTPDPVVAPAKWIADVLEAITGAYLVGQGEKGARYFLKWIGVTVLEHPSTNFARPFYPDCFPNELYDAAMTSRGGAELPLSLNFKVAQFEDLPKRLMLLQQRLKYTFRNKRLLLEAVTHPSVGQLVLHIDQMDANGADGNADGNAGGDIEVMSRSQKKKKTVWKGDYERLEYLGDALIEYLTLSYAFLMYDKWLPGSLSQWKSATVSNDALGKTALACFGVDECIFAGAVRIDRETMDRVAGIERKYARAEASTGLSPVFEAVGVSKKKAKSKNAPNGGNSHTLPKMFADVFEALVAAVFLDSGRDLQLVRDVFMGPLLQTVGQDAYAYVCHESGLAMDNTGDELMEDLVFSSDEED